ncbi:transposase [Patescibacteria group bacterium]|nr:transposase [Patescibacteria group bacterium]
MRLQDYDYSSDGAYFITLCAKNREYFFGEIRDECKNQKILIPTKIGEIAEKFWREIEKLHDFAIVDEFVVMPNHIHGIIFIQNNYDMVETRHDMVETRHDTVGNTPRYGRNTPRYGRNTPRYGRNTPRYGRNTPRYGRNTPMACFYE